MLKELRFVAKRFGGMLLPAGGRYTFLGGKIDRREDDKQAAIREAQEELLQWRDGSSTLVGIKEELKLLHIETDEKVGWKGMYYQYDCNDSPNGNVIRELNIEEINKSITTQYNLLLNELNSYVSSDFSPSEKPQELLRTLQELEKSSKLKGLEVGDYFWKKIEANADEEFSNIREEEYQGKGDNQKYTIEAELEIFSRFFLKVLLSKGLFLEDIESKKENIIKILVNVLKKLLSEQKTEGNVAAFKQLPVFCQRHNKMQIPPQQALEETHAPPTTFSALVNKNKYVSPKSGTANRYYNNSDAMTRNMPKPKKTL